MMVMAFSFKGIFGLERTVKPARTLTATPNQAICQPVPQPAAGFPNEKRRADGVLVRKKGLEL